MAGPGRGTDTTEDVDYSPTQDGTGPVSGPTGPPWVEVVEVEVRPVQEVPSQVRPELTAPQVLRRLVSQETVEPGEDPVVDAVEVDVQGQLDFGRPSAVVGPVKDDTPQGPLDPG